MRAQQRAAQIYFLLLTVAGIALAFVIAMWTTTLVAQRQEQMLQMAQMLADRNRELDAFAGRVAHDLRGPLTTVGLAATHLAKLAPGDDATAKALRNGVQRMDRMIEDLLALSRIGLRDPGATSEPNAIARSVVDDLGERARTEGATLNVEVKPATLRCSEGLLRQALSNLTDNALKYRRTEIPTTVEIRGEPNESVYRLSVSDNGMGMSDDDLHRIFEPFFRSPSSRDRPGTGLGLSIVKRAMEACGGTVSVTSTLGVGTTFTIELPLEANTTAGSG
jgi:signal transduction histidine kinase